MKRMLMLGAVLMGAIMLIAPMVHAEETEGNYTRAEAISAVNTLTATQLDALPIAGLGTTMAANIVANRPYVNIEDLGVVSGITVPDGVYYQNILTYFWGADMIPNEEGGPGTEQVIDETGGVSVSIDISPATSLGVVTESGDDILTFPALNSDYVKATEYVQVTANSNYGSWAVEIYTDNFPTGIPSTTTWGTQVGGLVDTATEQRISLGWCAFTSPFDEAPNVPGGYEDPDTLEWVATRWSYIKDKADTDASGGTSGAGSWDTRGGYSNVAFGGGDTAYVVNPMVGAVGGYVDTHTPGAPFYIYVETANKPGNPGSFTGSVNFDLYHQ